MIEMSFIKQILAAAALHQTAIIVWQAI